MIPKNWLLDKNHTYFPPNYNKMTIIQYDRLVLKMTNPNHDWNVYNIISIVGSRGNQLIINNYFILSILMVS